MKHYTIPDNYLTRNITYFLRWTLIAVMIGLFGGAVGTAFGFGVRYSVDFFQQHRWMLALLPAAGLLILLIYHLLGEDKNRGTNLVLESIYSENRIRFSMAPAVFCGSLLTHVCGGSAGREGAAVQMGGSIGSAVGRLLHLDDEDMNIAVMCGMASVFSALFGTPIAAAVFAMEVISVGVIYYAALVPCIFASFTAVSVANFFKLPPTVFGMKAVPALTVSGAVQTIILGVCASVVACLFCIVLVGTAQLAGYFLPDSRKRILAGGFLVILLTLIFYAFTGEFRYNNTGANLIVEGLRGEGRWYDFLAKILFTAVTLEAGFKGGEIVPAFSVGAAFGCLFAHISGLPAPLCAACGMLALFVGVTNAPIASLIIGLEMFGDAAMPYFAIVIAVSFALSGYYSLYSSQRIVYSKIKPRFIGRKATVPDIGVTKMMRDHREER